MATIQKVSGIDFANISKFDGVDISAVGSINFIGKPATGNLLLDTSYGSGAEAAYSVRKLRTAYTGAAIQVQATTGGATAEIGFDVDNNLDTATLLAFAGTNEVRVSIWYDQSLNLNNAVQTTVAQRPIVVAAGGALVEIDGRAAMNLDGGTDGFDITSNIQGAYSIFTIGNPGGNDRYYQDSTFGSRQYIIRNSSVAGSFSKYQNGTATSYLYGFTKELVEFISNAPTITYTNTLLMRFTNSSAYLGDFSEYIIYTSAKSGTNQTSIQENIGDYYTQNTPLLDTYSGAAAAYSLRKLRTDYTGFAIKVQDNVGGATQDIGFNVFGELDTVSLLQYAGSNDVFVETWYDQSGSGNDATQGSSSRRPQIVSSGVVEVENGKPILVSLGGSTGLENTVAGSTTQYSSAVMKHRGSGSSMFLSSGGSWILPASIGSSVSSSAQGATVSNLYLNGSVYSYTTWGAWATATSSQSLTTLLANNSTFSNADLGLTASTGYGMYSTQEVVIWNSDQSGTPQAGIESNINTFYDIYTPTPDPLLLNLYPGSAAAYSLRKLNANYTGSAILVQDTVGGATKAIGFDANGDLDTVELLAYAGSNDVLVATWFDQSGSGNDATQPSSSIRPKIVSSGAVIVDGTKPAILSEASKTFTTTLTLANDPTFASVVASNVSGKKGIVGLGGAAAYKIWSIEAWSNNNSFLFWIGNGTDPNYANIASTPSNVQALITAEKVNDISKMWRDGTLAGTLTNDYDSSGAVGFGQRNATGTAKYSEVIIYDSAQNDTTRAGIEENVGGYYDIVLPGLLDENPGAAAAYSLRRLSSTYTGSAIQVQRADNVGGTTDIGFDGYGNLDTAALTTAAAGNSMVVATWYDQSGNSNDAEQISSALRPQIVSSGAVIVDANGKPEVQFSALFSLDMATRLTQVQSNFSVRENITTGASVDFLYGDISTYDYHAGGTNNYLDTLYSSTDVRNGSNFVNGQSQSFTTANTATTSSVLLSMIHLSNTARISQICQDRSRSNRSWNGNMQEIILYENDQSAKLTDIEENIGGYYDIPLAGLLDENPGAAAAYSLRRLSSTYTGSAVQIQRADNVGGTTDIGFDSYGDLDTTALTTAAAGNSMVVTTWFDQSGSGNDATQGTSANRPKIYDATTGVVLENGKPAVDFDTFGMRLVAPNAASLQIIGDLFASVVTAGVNEIGHGPLFIKRTSDSQREYELRFNSATQMKYLDSFNNKNYAISSSANQRLFVLRRVADTSAELFENGLSISSQSLSGTAFTTTAGLSIGGREAGDYNLDGVLQEVILWPSQQTANRPSIEENIGGYYDIPLAGLLDENPGAAAAYSLRRLSSTYTGSAIQVQRADNVGGTTDIGFDSYGDLDTTALTTAAQGNDMVVTTWFDQSGSGNDATQGSSLLRPKIYDGTTGVIVENGKPALQSSNRQWLELTTRLTTIQSVFYTLTWDGNSGNAFDTAILGDISTLDYSGDGGAVNWFEPQYASNDVKNGSNFKNGSTSFNTKTANEQSLLSLFHLNATGKVSQIAKDRTFLTRGISGTKQEIILYTSDESAYRTDIESNINFFYDIY